MEILAPILLAIVLILVFVASYHFNKKTPKPEGCNEIVEACKGCNNFLCGNRTNKEE